MLSKKKSLPPLLIAVMLYCTKLELTVGIPKIVPLVKLRPSGNSGSTLNDATAPPPKIACSADDIASPLVKIR